MSDLDYDETYERREATLEAFGLDEPRGPEAPKIPLTRDRPARPTPPEDKPVRCPLCHGIERAGDITGGVCLTCAEGIAWSLNARRGAVDLDASFRRSAPPDVGDYGEQLAAKGGVIDPDIERRIIEKGG